MRTIYLIRHGKPEFPDERKYCIGRTDLPLSEEGRTQIRALGETFAGRRIEKIYTSPLKRCRESAAILQEVIDRSIPIEVVDGLAEIDMGEWDGHSFDEIREQFPAEYVARGADMYDFRPPQGESFADCAGRARTIWNEPDEEPGRYSGNRARGLVPDTDQRLGEAEKGRTSADSLWLRTGV